MMAGSIMRSALAAAGVGLTRVMKVIITSTSSRSRPSLILPFAAHAAISSPTADITGALALVTSSYTAGDCSASRGLASGGRSRHSRACAAGKVRFI